MAKTRWQDLVDFSGIQETEKQVQELGKEFQNLFKNIRSLSQSTNQEIQKNIQVFKDLRAQLTTLNTSTEPNRDRIAEIAQETIKLDQVQTNLKQTQQAQINTVSNLNKTYKGLREELSREKKALEDSNIATKEGRQEAEKAARNIQKLSLETRDLQKATRGANSSLTAAKGSYNALQIETEQLRRRLRNLEGGIEGTSQEFDQLQKRIAQNTQKLKDFDAGIGQNFRNVGNYPDLLEQVKSSFGGAFGAIPTGGVGIALAGLAALGAGLNALSKDILEFSKFMRQTQAITQQTGEELEKTTSALLATTQTFDQDFNEVLRAANAVSNEFGEDLDSVIEKINIAFVSGADLSGDLLDNLREYATQARSANLTLDEFINLNIESARRGFFNDKLIDAIKEVNLRLGDLNKAQRDSLNTLGDVGREVERLFLTGNQSEAIRLLSSEIVKLGNAGKNTQPIIANLFGAPGEDLGTKGIEVLATFDELNTELNDYQKLVIENAKASEEYNQAVLTLGQGFDLLNSEVGLLVKNIQIDLVNALNDLVGTSSVELRRATEDARRWAETIGDEEIAKTLDEIRPKIKQNADEVERLAKVANLEGDATLAAGQKAVERIEVLTAENMKFTALIQTLEARQTEIKRREEQERLRLERERLQQQELQVKRLKEIEQEQQNGLQNVVEISRKERESLIDVQEARDLIFKSRKKQEDLQTQIERKEAEERVRIAREEEERKKELRLEFSNLTFFGLDTLGTQLFTNNQIRRENELAALEQQSSAELELAGDNERAKDEIRKKFDEERKALQTQQAEAEKRRARFNILLSIAEGIARAIAASPVTFGLPFSAFVAAQGAIQLAAASTQPIPQFEEGTDGKTHKGLAVVNEQFNTKGSEVFKTDGKYYTLNTDGPALVNFDRPTEVIGYDDLAKLSLNNANMFETEKMYKRTTAGILRPNSNNSVNLEKKLDNINSSIKNLSIGISVNGKKQKAYKMSRMRNLNIVQYG